MVLIIEGRNKNIFTKDELNNGVERCKLERHYNFIYGMTEYISNGEILEGFINRGI